MKRTALYAELRLKTLSVALVGLLAVAEGGVRETIKDGFNGFLIDGEPEAIAQSINRLLGDAELAKDMGERACQYIR